MAVCDPKKSWETSDRKKFVPNKTRYVGMGSQGHVLLPTSRPKSATGSCGEGGEGRGRREERGERREPRL